MTNPNFTTKSVRQLIDLKTDLLATIKFQPILSDGCGKTIAEIDAEMQTRGLYPIRLNHEVIKPLP